MQVPQSSTTAKKYRSPESPVSPIGTDAPVSFFAQLSAAADAAGANASASGQPAGAAEVPRTRAAKTADRQCLGGAGVRDSPANAASEATAAKAPEAGKPSRLRGRVPGARDAPDTEAVAETLLLGANVDPTREHARAAGSVSDRRVASRRSDDGPASNANAPEWIRPAWMTQERIQSVLDSQTQGADALDPVVVSVPVPTAISSSPISISTFLSPADGSAASAPATAERCAASASPQPQRGTGAAGLAHDASNLLAALMLYSELLSFPEVLPERYRHYADDLKLLAERSRTLIDRLVSFGGAVDGERPIDKGQVSLVDAVMHCEGLLSTLARGALQVTFGAQAALPVAVAPESLERILVNLVKNAAQATRTGGAVRIGVGLCRTEEGAPSAVGSVPSAESSLSLAPPRYRSAARNQGRGPGARATPRNEARRMMLTVDDSGCGMTEQQIARILNPAANPDYGADPAPLPASPQPGIGLRVVRELVLASGGKLGITSRIEVGTRIEIQWPVAEAETAERPLVPSSSLGANVPVAPQRKQEEGAAPSADDTVPGTVPTMEKIADPGVTLGDFAAGFAGGLSEPERRLLTKQTSRQGKQAASAHGTAERDGKHNDEFNAEFKGFNHDSKGAIAC
jgi:signal transduction histidine kinase